MEWMGGIGVRYQALWWGSIELGVRFREDEGLSQTTALVRLNGVLAPKSHLYRERAKNQLAN
jgi:hypothetical protein